VSREPSQHEYVRLEATGTRGVGVEVSNVVGLAFGDGIFRNVDEACSYLMVYWEPGARVFRFGCSRGTDTARLLAAVRQHARQPPDDLAVAANEHGRCAHRRLGGRDPPVLIESVDVVGWHARVLFAGPPPPMRRRTPRVSAVDGRVKHAHVWLAATSPVRIDRACLSRLFGQKHRGRSRCGATTPRASPQSAARRHR